MKIFVWIISCLFIVTLNSSFAAVVEKDIFDLSIKELMQVRISLATKTEETVLTVPSTITVFERTDIESLGVKNAYDVMNFVPGFQMTRGDWVGAVPKEHARGVYLDNGYILVMLNGERLNEVSFGKASVYTPHIPIDIIERIEVIRGPGSALYGSNAFLGVLNIITQQSVKQLKVSIGEKGYKQLSSSWQKSLSKNLRLHSNISIEKSNGHQYTSPLNRQVKDPYSNTYLELGAHYKNNKLNIRYSENELDEFINLGGYSVDNIHTSESFSISGKSKIWHNDKHQLEIKASYSLFEIKSAGMALAKESGLIENDFLVGPFWRTQSSDVNLDHSWIVNPRIHLNSGVEYRRANQFQSGNAVTYYDYQQERIIVSDENYLDKIVAIAVMPETKALNQAQAMHGIYSQLKWQVANNISLFLGARYDNVIDIDHKLSPRAAAVWQANKNHSLKLQYGESFRTPVNNELYSNDSVTNGNPNLSSEFVKTTELVWIYQHNDFSSELVFFHNDLRDFINKVPDDGDAQFTFVNHVDMEISGLESSASVELTPKLRFSVNYTHLFDDPINESFKHFGSANLSYKSGQWKFNVNGIWRDEVTLPPINDVRFIQKQYFLISGKVTYELDKKQQLSFIAQNLLDKDYVVFDPRVFNGEVPGKGREISVSYRYQF
ncbi:MULTISPECIES: TonB-dependent siderophore receptor [unclassified Colwellia]|uniref:TonB-dependent receptor plug domain-containing protein n=1 Tax=unclassified Colwellia TaxID=196834 RepID=UPI0015F6072D|nr:MULTISPECIES: TonB-dependent receptor [unclassified Colwellia]MBA6356713.1 TonB-dependent receptor [Colwellia sp. BRX8-3]MBA6359042.1 TonB-dependent receptor [Colwellia sp. BRX8-6]MBA6369258.1 TonB-dependent receptor [Colwellia sp. BRX8-5]MBA6375323.1 TonB-dependent receptor [Colwellia sp. BRX8-2]|tara:strand:- start:1694 stop:3685 length:1992 start_codon:yes stop_codon:yes gene_type:complete